MRIVNVAYNINHDFKSAETWFSRTDAFNGVLVAMAQQADIVNIHFIDYEGTIIKDGVTHYFKRMNKIEKHLPFQINRFIASLTPDIVLIHGLLYPHQLVLLKLQLSASVKLVIQHHAEKALSFPRSIFQKLADRFVSAYFFASRGLAKPWQDAGQIRDSAKIHEVMEVSSYFYPIPDKHNNSDFRNTYLWVGRLDKNKDPFTLIEGFKIFQKSNPDAKLILVYRGDELASEVLPMMDVPGIVVKKDVPNAELLHWYNSAAFVVSTSHYEGSGTAVCEGMSCGCIPILSDIPSFRMMTDNGAVGFLFKTQSADSLAEALCKSRMVDIDMERAKILQQFEHTLSFNAIANKMMDVMRILV